MWKQVHKICENAKVIPFAVRLLFGGHYSCAITEFHYLQHSIYTLINTTHGRFLNTLLPAGGGSAVAVAFFPAALTPAPFFSVVGAFFAFLTIVVPVDIAELLLVLLTVLSPSISCLFSGAFFDLAAAFPAAALGRPGFGLSGTILARVAVAAAAAATFDLVGEVIGFNGDAVRELKDF